MYYFMEEFYIDKFRFPTIKYDEPIKDTYTEKEVENNIYIYEVLIEISIEKVMQIFK